MDRRRFSLSFAGLSLASAALSPSQSSAESSTRLPAITGASTFTQVGKQKNTSLSAFCADRKGIRIEFEHRAVDAREFNSHANQANVLRSSRRSHL
jgi:hypothetical protein